MIIHEYLFQSPLLKAKILLNRIAVGVSHTDGYHTISQCGPESYPGKAELLTVESKRENKYYSKTTALKISIFVSLSFQASCGRPALRHVCSRNVIRFQLYSVATCGRRRP